MPVKKTTTANKIANSKKESEAIGIGDFTFDLKKSLREQLDESPVYQQVVNKKEAKVQAVQDARTKSIEGYEDYIREFMELYFSDWRDYEEYVFDWFRDKFYRRMARYQFTNPNAVIQLKSENPLERIQSFNNWVRTELFDSDGQFQAILTADIYNKLNFTTYTKNEIALIEEAYDNNDANTK